MGEFRRYPVHPFHHTIDRQRKPSECNGSIDISPVCPDVQVHLIDDGIERSQCGGLPDKIRHIGESRNDPLIDSEAILPSVQDEPDLPRESGIEIFHDLFPILEIPKRALRSDVDPYIGQSGSLIEECFRLADLIIAEGKIGEPVSFCDIGDIPAGDFAIHGNAVLLSEGIISLLLIVDVLLPPEDESRYHHLGIRENKHHPIIIPRFQGFSKGR